MFTSTTPGRRLPCFNGLQTLEKRWLQAKKSKRALTLKFHTASSYFILYLTDISMLYVAVEGKAVVKSNSQNMWEKMKKRLRRRGYNRLDNDQIEFSNLISILYRKNPLKLYALKGFREYLGRKKRKSAILFTQDLTIITLLGTLAHSSQCARFRKHKSDDWNSFWMSMKETLILALWKTYVKVKYKCDAIIQLSMNIEVLKLGIGITCLKIVNLKIPTLSSRNAYVQFY